MVPEDLVEETAWAALSLELDRWAEAGRAATFWWRDDDAAAVTPALERLLCLGAEFDTPLALAVIPGEMSADLAPRLAGYAGASVLQHGWRHLNHARRGEDDACRAKGAWELGDHRPLEQVNEDLDSGRRRLAETFGAQSLPVLVPPWNRISARVTETLPTLGFLGLSTFRARQRREVVPGLVQVNAHCDPVRWKQGGRFAGTARALDDLTSHLAARRTGAADPAEPTGLVTHHLALDPPTWEFVFDLLRRTRAHSAARWLSAADAFRP